jgi:hypothetical protein
MGPSTRSAISDASPRLSEFTETDAMSGGLSVAAGWQHPSRTDTRTTTTPKAKNTPLSAMRNTPATCLVFEVVGSAQLPGLGPWTTCRTDPTGNDAFNCEDALVSEDAPEKAAKEHAPSVRTNPAVTVPFQHVSYCTHVRLPSRLAWRLQHVSFSTRRDWILTGTVVHVVTAPQEATNVRGAPTQTRTTPHPSVATMRKQVPESTPRMLPIFLACNGVPER